jgi:hypothetical protein
MIHAAATRVLAAAALSALAIAGCKKDSIDKREVPAAVTAGLAALPKDATMVFGVDLAKARGTEVWKKYAPQLMADLPPELAELKAACGFDPITQVDTAMFTVGADVEDPKGVAALIKGQFKEDQIAKCMTDMAAKEQHEVAIAKDGKVTVYTNKTEGKNLYAHWVAADTVVLVPGALDDPAAARALAEGGGADKNAQLGEMLQLIDTGAVFWGAGALPQMARDQMKAMGYVPDGFVVEIDVPGDVKIGFGLRYEDDKAAESSFKFFKMGLDEAKKSPPLPMLKDLMSTVEVKHTGRMVKVSATLTMKQVEEVAGMAAGLGGGLGF